MARSKSKRFWQLLSVTGQSVGKPLPLPTVWQGFAVVGQGKLCAKDLANASNICQTYDETLGNGVTLGKCSVIRGKALAIGKWQSLADRLANVCRPEEGKSKARCIA
jgi:hypothetical protein